MTEKTKLSFLPLIKDNWDGFVNLFGEWGVCGVSKELIIAASSFAKTQVAKIIEGYPIEPKSGMHIPAAFA